MKKSDIALIVGVVLIILIGGFVIKGNKVSYDVDLPLALAGEPGLHELSYSEYKEKVDNNESFVLIIERATCSHCVSFMPVAEEFAKTEGLPMYYVDTDTFTKKEWASFEKTNTYLKKNANNWGTPTTLVLSGFVAVDYVVGESDAEELKTLYENSFDLDSYKNS